MENQTKAWSYFVSRVTAEVHSWLFVCCSEQSQLMPTTAVLVAVLKPLKLEWDNLKTIPCLTNHCPLPACFTIAKCVHKHKNIHLHMPTDRHTVACTRSQLNSWHDWQLSRRMDYFGCQARGSITISILCLCTMHCKASNPCQHLQSALWYI